MAGHKPQQRGVERERKQERPSFAGNGVDTQIGNPCLNRELRARIAKRNDRQSGMSGAHGLFSLLCASSFENWHGSHAYRESLLAMSDCGLQP